MGRASRVARLAAILGLAWLSWSAWQGVSSAAEVAWLAEVQTPPAKALTGVPQLAPLLVDRDGRKIETRDAWKVKREELRREWLRVLGEPKIARSPLPRVTILEEDEVGDVLRRRIRYSAGPEWETEAYLLRPKPGSALAAKPQPAAIVLHSTVDHTIRQPAGLEGPPEKFFGLKLAQRGFACICPRNYLWQDGGKIAAQGEAERFVKQYPGSTGMAKMLHDAQLALDLLLAEPNIDVKHVTAVGHSLGAKEVVYLAAFDDRVSCTVSSEGGIGTKYSNWDALWYLGPQIRSPDFPREHHELLALIAPRPFLLIGGDSADGDRSWPFIEAAIPVYKLLDDSPARIGLLNHKLGHSVPASAETKIYEWIERYGR
jgi:dienelactone hydrolase